MLAELATGLTRAERATTRDLADRPELDPGEAQRLARLLSALIRSEDEEPHEGPDVAPNADALVEAARDARADPQGAAVDPDALIRVATAVLMKDRAATVGAQGVADLLLRLQATPSSKLPERRRIHVVGHSYGAKVMLAALSSAPATLGVDSVLLLQPAVSAWCFTEGGAYRPALERTRQPLVTTFSKNDSALNRVQGKNAALGGEGPLGANAQVLAALEPPAEYDFTTANRLVGVDGSRVIHDHDDVSSDATAWLLLAQVRA